VLEELSELVNFTTLEAEDGTLGVYLGGEATLVIGDRQYMLDTDFSTSQTALRLNGSDVTRMARAGRLGATLEVSNRFIPGYLADLDVLAQSFADSVNNTLAAGLDANGQPPVNPLFTTDPMTSAAATLDVSPLVPGELAVAANGAPGGNGNALALGSLVASKVVGGYTFAEYYGTIAARAGRELDAARETAHTQEALVTQARALRAEISGVSLDEEAAFLLQFQRAYQASARVFTTIDEMTETIIGLLR
jgi:flagellar hook-associated protein 1 FlgK